ncbi:MAG: hypothetical protein HC908_01480 [Calothrix sp. SM1_7_51]|nr:hypothetical protein [Calothrix sp. SM1_7_51]
MSKRVFVTLPDSVFEDLEQWADSQGRPTANLAAFLIETSIRQAKERGGDYSEKPTTEQR